MMIVLDHEWVLAWFIWGVPECIYTIEAVKFMEAIVFPLADQSGKLSKDAIKEIGNMLSDMEAVLVGPD